MKKAVCGTCRLLVSPLLAGAAHRGRTEFSLVGYPAAPPLPLLLRHLHTLVTQIEMTESVISKSMLKLMKG